MCGICVKYDVFSFLLYFQKNDGNQWIQFNFGKESVVSTVRTFGDRKESYIKRYSIQFSEDGNTWQDYVQQGVKRVRTILL